jgi:hypothetical protein
MNTKFPKLKVVLDRQLGARKTSRLLATLQDISPFEDNTDLKQAFIWDESPQGHNFWSDIYRKIYPNEW